MIWFSLIRRFWWAIPLLGLLAALGISRMEVRHLRTANGALKAQILQFETVLKANDSKAKHDKETADAALQSSSKAAALLGASLSSRVRDYQVRSCPVQAPGEPVAAIGGSAPAATVGPSVDALIGSVIEACTRDSARLDNAHDWAKGLGDGTPDPRP